MKYIKPSTLPYGSILEATRNVLEIRIKDFPNQGCQFTSRLLSSLRPIVTLDEVGGYFRHSSVQGTKNHVWVEDKQRGLYIDLTLDQFLDRAPRVAIMKNTSPVLIQSPTIHAGAINVPTEKYFTEEGLTAMINMIADERVRIKNN